MTVRLRTFTVVSRPYRLELVGVSFSTTTYATEDRARDAASRIGVHKWVTSGSKWRITKRLNKSGSKVEVIAEGVVP